MKTLKEIAVGQTVTVKRLHGEGPVKRRIMDMGITKGVKLIKDSADQKLVGMYNNISTNKKKEQKNVSENCISR